MQSRFSACGGYTVFCLGLLLLVAAASAVRAADDVEGDPSLAEMEQRLAIYQAANQADPQNAKLAELYAAALASLKESAENRAESARFERLFGEAPAKIERYAVELRDLQRETRSAKSLSESVAVARLERVLRETRERLETLRTTDARLQETVRTLQRRNEGARQELKQANAATEYGAAPTERAGESKALSQARRDEWRARRALRASLVARLDTEIRTIPERLAAVQAQQKLVGAQREQAERFLAELLEMDTLKRISEAEQERERIAARLLTLNSPHPDVVALKQEVTALADERVQVVTGAETTAEELDAANARLGELRTSASSIRQQLNIASIDNALGPVLMEHYLKLSTYERPGRQLRRIGELLASARLREFQVGQLLQSEVQLRERVYRAIEGTAELDGVAFTRAARATAIAVVDRLLEARGEMLDSLSRNYVHATEQLVELDNSYSEQAEVAEDFRKLLDRNLIWMTSHRPLNLRDLFDWPASTWQLLTQHDWRSLAPALGRAVQKGPLNVLAVVLVLGFIQFYGPTLRRRTETRSVRGGGWHNYRFPMALEAIGTHLLMALPLPLLLVMLGWLCTRIDEPGPMASALSGACVATAPLGYAYLVIREMLRTQGYARQHLRWKAARVQAVGGLLGLALWVLLPLMFFNALTGGLAVGTAQDQCWRIGPLFASLLFFVFSVLIARAARGMFNAAFFSRTPPLLMRISRLLIIVIIAIQPLVLLLDVLGYHFTAQELQQRAYLTIALLLLTKVLIDTGLLGITLAAQRSIAAQQQEEVRAETEEQATAPAKPGEAGDDLNLERMNASAALLLNYVVFGSAVLILLSIWSQFFTALEVLDSVALWKYETVINGADAMATVSLFDVGKALLILALGLVLAKGLPSLIGIVAYSFITQKGVLFAIQTVISYAIATAGVVVALQTLGFGWSKLQWMAAGLSVGVGFGMQEIFANFFSGLIMLFERPVRIGDVITIGEYSGTIQRIRMRATTITDFDNREIIVPNKMFVTERLINWTLSSPVVRVSFDVGISYDADPRLARETLLRILGEDPRVLRDPEPNVVFREFGASSLNLRCSVHVEDLNVRFQVQNDLHMRITEVFREKGIEIAYPQMDLHLRSVDDAAQGKF